MPLHVATILFPGDFTLLPAITRKYQISLETAWFESNNCGFRGQVQLFHVNIGELQLCQVLEAPGGHSDIVRAFYWNHQTQSILTGGEDGRMCAWQGTS